MRIALAVALFILLAGCSGSTPKNGDSGSPPADMIPVNTGDAASSEDGSAASDMTSSGDGKCGTTTCAADELCFRPVPCPSGPEIEPSCIPIPAGCDGEPACGCFAEDPCGGGCSTCGGVVDGQLTCGCTCRCNAPDTPIATPEGERAIASLQRGDLVYSIERGAVVVVPIERTIRVRAENHRVVRLELDSGRVLHISPAHPTADGRTVGELRRGDQLGSASVRNARLVPYREKFTYDILPASASGSYFAAGALLGSTLDTRSAPAHSLRR